MITTYSIMIYKIKIKSHAKENDIFI